MSEFRDRLAEALRDEYGVLGGLGLGWRGYADRLLASEPLRSLLAQRAAVEALAEDMETWCSPFGVAPTYAERIREALAAEADR